MDVAARINAIRGIHLFPGMPEEKLWTIAEKMEPVTLPSGTEIFKEGDRGDAFYVVVRGRVDISYKVKKEVKKATTFVRGDYFGETAILRKTKRNATAKTDGETVLLKMSDKDFDQLLKTVPKLQMVFKLVAETREILHRMYFEWREDDEVVYFISRKHVVTLLVKLISPFLIFLPGLVFFLFGLYSMNQTGNIAWLIGIPLMAVGAAWALWRYLDWGNDYYAVTNKRVVLKEKVIGIHESRTEALLSTIRTVSVETGYWDRWLDVGNVVVSTFVSKFRMDGIVHPRQVAAMIEEYWQRTKQVMAGEQRESLHKVIRDRINPPPPPPPKPAAPVAPAPDTAKKKPISIKNLFALRIETEGSVIYHKHWYVLIRDSWIRLLAFFVLLMFSLIWLIYVPQWLSLVWLAALGMGLVAAYWIVWDYNNWNNDLYMVTPDKIIDIYRVPFGQEERRDAPLTNIQTIGYQRNGIIGTLMNFGDVNIAMGGNTVFDFVDVFDPPRVQSDIIRRLNLAIKKRADAEAQADQAQMLNFIADYHSIAEELRKLDPPKM